MFEDTPTVLFIMEWLISPANAGIVISIFIAIVLEKLAFWHKLSSLAKGGIVAILTACLGLLGHYASMLMLDPANADLVAQIELYMRPIMFIIVAWVSSQIAHWMSKIKNPPQPPTISLEAHPLRTFDPDLVVKEASPRQAVYRDRE